MFTEAETQQSGKDKLPFSRKNPSAGTGLQIINNHNNNNNNEIILKTIIIISEHKYIKYNSKKLRCAIDNKTNQKWPISMKKRTYLDCFCILIIINKVFQSAADMALVKEEWNDDGRSQKFGIFAACCQSRGNESGFPLLTVVMTMLACSNRSNIFLVHKTK